MDQNKNLEGPETGGLEVRNLIDQDQNLESPEKGGLGLAHTRDSDLALTTHDLDHGIQVIDTMKSKNQQVC